MRSSRRAALLVTLSLCVPLAARAATTIEYDFTTKSVRDNGTPIVGSARVTTTIDGPTFRNVSRLGQAIERSDDDGRTTRFGDLESTPQTPLAWDADDPIAPIAGSIDDEHLDVGESTAGPTLFGLPTRVYTVDYRYTIVARIAYLVRRRTPIHARMTFTVCDFDVSNAALRVAFSRGHGYALAHHPEAFSGLPLVIDGTIESSFATTHVHVEAASLRR